MGNEIRFKKLQHPNIISNMATLTSAEEIQANEKKKIYLQDLRRRLDISRQFIGYVQLTDAQLPWV